MPGTSPVTTQASGPEDQVQVLPPGVAVTVYPVIGEPPFEAGADHDTSTAALPATAVGAIGAVGDPIGVTDAEGAEAAPVPTAFAAFTVKVYACPLVSPDTVHVSGPEDHVQVLPPGEEVTV